MTINQSSWRPEMHAAEGAGTTTSTGNRACRMNVPSRS